MHDEDWQKGEYSWKRGGKKPLRERFLEAHDGGPLHAGEESLTLVKVHPPATTFEVELAGAIERDRPQDSSRYAPYAASCSPSRSGSLPETGSDLAEKNVRELYRAFTADLLDAADERLGEDILPVSDTLFHGGEVEFGVHFTSLAMFISFGSAFNYTTKY